jgi:hypothetical protein
MFVKVAEAVVYWGLRLGGLFAFAMVIYAGLQYLTAGGNATKQKEAQEKIFNAIIGIILLFSFWLILNTINPNILLKPWSAPTTNGTTVEETEPDKEKPDMPTEPQELTEEDHQQIMNFVLIGAGSGDYADIPLSYEFPDGAYIDQKTAVKLLQLAQSAPGDWVVTEACVSISPDGKCITTYGSHVSSCHELGTCVDVGFGGDPGDYIRTEFIYAANQAGFNVIDEYSPAWENAGLPGSGFHLEPDMINCEGRQPADAYFCI